jgi:hypothetical protein
MLGDEPQRILETPERFGTLRIDEQYFHDSSSPLAAM